MAAGGMLEYPATVAAADDFSSNTHAVGIKRFPYIVVWVTEPRRGCHGVFDVMSWRANLCGTNTLLWSVTRMM